jgi:hypothetical protein
MEFKEESGRKLILFSCFFISLLLFSGVISSLSPEAERVGKLIEEAKQAVEEMVEREIPILRANESLQESIIFYNDQVTLEKLRKVVRYDFAEQYAQNVLDVKEIAFKAQDELRIFIETYNDASEGFDFSEMEAEYNAVLASFEEERFEDTIKLIDKGYQKISEVQSSQTAVNLFYKSTSRSLKSFFINNWLKLLITFISVILFLIIFWKALSKIKVRMQLNRLYLRRETLYALIRRSQKDYFDKKTMSESEFSVKMESFNNMIRDIDRQIPLLKEEMLKLGKKKSLTDSFSGEKKVDKKNKTKKVKIENKTKKVKMEKKIPIKKSSLVKKKKNILTKKVPKKGKKVKKKSGKKN